MRSTHGLLRLCGAVILAAMTFGLAGCGNDPAKVAVADYGNSRVLIYDNSLTTDAPASVVLGQPDFTTASGNQGGNLADNTFALPTSVAQDSHGNLFISDFSNCRVLEFQPPFKNNMSAAVVIGEADFVSNTCSDLANGVGWSFSTTVDGRGNLWVADFKNSRVVEFQPPFSNGMAASLAIGQTTLNGALGCNMGAGPTANSLCNPMWATFDPQGNLWVADAFNNRILEYVPPFSTGMDASLELGQPSGAGAFTSDLQNNPTLSANTLNLPHSAAFDGKGNLWVADANNGRVLKYAPPFRNGMAANLVLGPADFTSINTAASANSVGFPWGLAFEPSGSLVVSDMANSRVLNFRPPFSNGMNASTVLGQPNFSSASPNQGQGAPTAKTLDAPVGVTVIH